MTGPRDRVDSILDAIDVGLQEAGDISYDRPVPEGKCWRCTRRDADKNSPSGVCIWCRADLLGDPPPPDDPSPPDRQPVPCTGDDCPICQSLRVGGVLPIPRLRGLVFLSPPTMPTPRTDEP